MSELYHDSDIWAYVYAKADSKDDRCHCDIISDDGGECPNCEEAFILMQAYKEHDALRKRLAAHDLAKRNEGLEAARPVWSDTAPTQEGWYWFVSDYDTTPHVVNLLKDGDGILCLAGGDMEYFDIAEMGKGQWAPCPAPMED